jgi:ankyrin repeat protein
VTHLRGGKGISAAVLAIALLTGAIAPDDRVLLDAAKRGDVAAVRSLLEDGADPNAAQGDGLSALHLAAQEGNLEIAKLLIDARANVEAETRIGAYTPLHLASGGGHTPVVGALLDAGANTGAVSSTTGATALHLAAKALNGEGVIKLLLKKGALVDARESQGGQTALMLAASYGRIASVRELLSHGADPAISTKVVDVLKTLVIDKEAQARLREAVLEIREGFAVGTDRDLTPSEEQLAIAAQREFLRSEEEIAKVLEGFHPDDLATPGRSLYNTGPQFTGRPLNETLVGKTGGMTALLLASRDGRVEAVKALLDGGADIDQVSDGDGSSPLVLTLLNGQFDVAMVLIERGANPSLATSTDGIAPLFATFQAQWALKNTSQPGPKGQESAKTEHLEVLSALLEAGADPNVRLKSHLRDWEQQRLGIDVKGATPFWRATFAQDLDAMKLLVAYGADPNIPSVFPEVGLRARRQRDGRQQEDSGLPFPAEGSPDLYPIQLAAGGGYMGIGAFQQNNVPNNFLNTVKYLVEEHGADVNLPDSWGYTPLHYASVRGGNDVIEYLVSKGGDVKAVSRMGQSVVDVARGGQSGFFKRTPYPKTVELLVSLGSPFLCLKTHFRDTGDFCPGAGVPPFSDESVFEEQERVRIAPAAAR